MNSIADSLLLAAQLISRADADLLAHRGAVAARQRHRLPAGRRLIGLALGAWLAVARFPGHAARWSWR